MRDVHRNPLTNFHWHVLQSSSRVRRPILLLFDLPSVSLSDCLFRLCFVKLKLLLLALEVRTDIAMMVIRMNMMLIMIMTMTMTVTL